MIRFSLNTLIRGAKEIYNAVPVYCHNDYYSYGGYKFTFDIEDSDFMILCMKYPNLYDIITIEEGAEWVSPI